MIKLLIIGPNGKMGRALVKAAAETPQYKRCRRRRPGRPRLHWNGPRPTGRAGRTYSGTGVRRYPARDRRIRRRGMHRAGRVDGRLGDVPGAQKGLRDRDDGILRRAGETEKGRR
jgi:hypothetical protein